MSVDELASMILDLFVNGIRSPRDSDRRQSPSKRYLADADSRPVPSFG
jgi:hypothetical protein